MVGDSTPRRPGGHLAARIESYTLGGEVLIADATLADAKAIVRESRAREVHPKETLERVLPGLA
jgi:class 3 adenylate cyclase